MNLSEPDLETRLREALTHAVAPIYGDGIQREAVVQAVARRRRTRWAARAALVATTAAAAVALVLLARADGGRVDTSTEGPSSAATENTRPEPPASSSTSSSTTSSSTTSSSTSTTSTSVPTTPALGPDTPLSRSGIGPIRTGMTVREAEQAAGVTITPGEPIGPGSNCVVALIENLDISLQLSITGVPGEDLTQGVVTLVDGQGVASTVEGVAVGDPVAKVTATYGPPTLTFDYPYVPNGTGEVLVYDDGDYAYGVIVDGSTVLQLQSGYATAVPSIEGCV